MNTKLFENQRWLNEDQIIQFRHNATLLLVEDGNVLDLGSGDGLLLSLLKNRGISGEGLDLSEEGVAKANFKGIKSSVFDFGNKPLPFPEKSFNTIIILDVLEHLYDPKSVLREAARVSRHHVIVGVPNFSSLPARVQVFIGMVPENNKPKKGHVYWFTKSVLDSLTQSVGLEQDIIRVNSLWEAVPLVGLISRLLARFWPGLFGLSFVVRYNVRHSR